MMAHIKRNRILKFVLMGVVLLSLSFASSASAASKPITIYVNDQLVTTSLPPFVENGRTLVPFRAILEALGATVQWDASSQSVIASKDASLIKLKIGTKQAALNGKSLALDVPARIVNDRTFIPVRFVSENLGYKVVWYSNNRTIKINAVAVDPFVENGMDFKINVVGNIPADLDKVLYEKLKQETVKVVYTKISENHVVSMDIGISSSTREIVFMVTTEVSTSHQNIGKQGRLLSYKVIYRQTGDLWYLYNISDQ